MSIPRGLSSEEQAAWARLAESVTPLAGRTRPKPSRQVSPGTKATVKPAPKPVAPKKPKPAPGASSRNVAPPPPRKVFSSELDSHWNRKLKAGQIAPDYTLDLHGHTLDSAYGRIVSGLDQARARRGAIRAKLLDWLAASHHADSIAAVRRAHIRHGGEGALYLILRRIG